MDESQHANDTVCVGGTPAVRSADAGSAVEDASEARGDSRRSLEERLAELERKTSRQPLHREIYYKTLRYCAGEPKPFSDVERAIAGMPEFAQALNDPCHLISVLEGAGGLRYVGFDEEDAGIAKAGAVGAGEAESVLSAEGEARANGQGGFDAQEDDGEGRSRGRSGLGGEIAPEDEGGFGGPDGEAACDVRERLCVTTDAGEELVRRYTPKSRFDRLVEMSPWHEGAYRSIVSACAQKAQSRASIERLLAGNPALDVGVDGAPRRVSPSMFLDKLERAGMIGWQGGWVLTEEGRRCLTGMGSDNR